MTSYVSVSNDHFVYIKILHQWHVKEIKKDLAIIPFKSPMCFFLHYTSMGTQYEVMPLLCSEPIIIPLKIIEPTNKTSFIHCTELLCVLNT